MKKIVFLFIILSTSLLMVSVVDAQDKSMQDVLKQMEQEQAKAQEQQKKQLEMLKKQDPKMYERMATQQAAQEQIAKILKDFRANKISESQARSKLRPLVKEMMKERIANLDTEIAAAEKRLQALKVAKSNPDKMVDQSVDMYLGKAVPSSDTMF
jgi:lipase chaperone LimK